MSGKVTLLGGEGPALALARGVIYSVHAQDLLQSLGALSPEEEKKLNTMPSSLFDIVRQSDNVKFGYGGIPFPAPPAARYNNVNDGALTSLLAVARLLDDSRKLNAVVFGGDPSIPLASPWIRLFNRVIYGQDDHPLECGFNMVECTPNKDPHAPGFQTAEVAPGEVVDRIRNEHAGNSFGYSVGVLRGFINAAEILRISGFDSYGYRGSHRQAIQMAIGYYSCFAKGAGFYKTVTAENSGACPDAAQYYGKLVNDLERVVILGSYLFPQDESITAKEADAKIVSRAFPVDTVVFGRWRD